MFLLIRCYWPWAMWAGARSIHEYLQCWWSISAHSPFQCKSRLQTPNGFHWKWIRSDSTRCVSICISCARANHVHSKDWRSTGSVVFLCALNKSTDKNDVDWLPINEFVLKWEEFIGFVDLSPWVSPIGLPKRMPVVRKLRMWRKAQLRQSCEQFWKTRREWNDKITAVNWCCECTSGEGICHSNITVIPANGIHSILSSLFIWKRSTIAKIRENRPIQ